MPLEFNLRLRLLLLVLPALLTASAFGAAAKSSAPAPLSSKEWEALESKLDNLQIEPVVPPPPETAARPASGGIATVPFSLAGTTGSVRVAVTSINDSRNLTGNTLTLGLSVFTEGTASNTVLRRIEITRAVDNLGRTLSGSAGRGSLPSTLLRPPSTARAGNPVLQGSATMQSPSRTAEFLRTVEGRVEYFSPSESNGSMVVIPGFRTRPGSLNNVNLGRHGIDFRILDRAGYDAIKGSVPAPPAPPDFAGGSLAYYIRDPANAIVAYEVQDAAGNMLATRQTGGYSSSASGITFVTFAPVTPVPDDARLVIYLAAPEAVKTVGFKLENVTLP